MIKTFKKLFDKLFRKKKAKINISTTTKKQNSDNELSRFNCDEPITHSTYTVRKSSSTKKSSKDYNYNITADEYLGNSNNDCGSSGYNNNNKSVYSNNRNDYEHTVISGGDSNSSSGSSDSSGGGGI